MERRPAKKAKNWDLAPQREKRGRLRGKISPPGASFFQEEEAWEEELQRGAFAARVLEVHKGYAFVCREDRPGVLEGKDLWLSPIGPKALAPVQGERSPVCVGDRVLVRPCDSSPSEELPLCRLKARRTRCAGLGDPRP